MQQNAPGDENRDLYPVDLQLKVGEQTSEALPSHCTYYASM